MDARKIARFAGCESFLACPVCREPLALDGASLACPQGHRFDIARQGYVNLLGRSAGAAAYDRASFEARRLVFESGLYAPITDAVCEALPASDLPTLDAGCGEGSFSHALGSACAARVCALDISRDSVRMAASVDPEDGIAWVVADLAAIPLLDGSAGCVLDAFSPANYGEFKRVLAPHGRLIKVVPTEGHLREIRDRAAEQLRGRDRYSNERVISHFEQFCRIIDRRRVTNRMSLAPEAFAALLAMTPLLFSVDASEIDWSGLDEVTVEADVLVGAFE